MVTRKVKASDELRPEYKREDVGVGVRSKYFESYQRGTNLVLLSHDVATVFATEESVNEAIRRDEVLDSGAARAYPVDEGLARVRARRN